MPPNTKPPAMSNRAVTGSPSKTTPAATAMTGTLSWEIAAIVTGNAGNTRYHSA